MPPELHDFVAYHLDRNSCDDIFRWLSCLSLSFWLCGGNLFVRTRQTKHIILIPDKLMKASPVA
jgi:hypothetical protein